MGLRFYLSNLAAGYTPATVRGSWSDAALTGASKLSLLRGGAQARIDKAETSTSSSWSALLRRFVSDPVNNAAALAGAGQIGITPVESNAAMNANLRIYAYVTVGSTDAIRGVLTDTAINSSSEWPTASFGFVGWGQVTTLPALSSVNAQPGDRVVVEIGYRAANTVATSYTGSVYHGGLAGDVRDWDPAGPYGTERSGWIEFDGAGWINAFSPPFRSGLATMPIRVGSGAATSRKRVKGSTVTQTGPGSSLPVGRKRMKVTTATHVMHNAAGSKHIGKGAPATSPTIKHVNSAVHNSFGGTAVTELRPGNIIYSTLPGDVDLPDPDLELLTEPPRPKPRTPLRFIAQDILTKRFLDWDLPLVDPEITFNLSGPKIIKAKLKPEFPSLAELNIDPWATYIHVEEDGQILASGILLPASVDDEEYDVMCLGVSGYAKDMPYWGDDSLVQIDVCQVLRGIWGHLYSYPDANLGVRVTGAESCGTLLGIPERQARDEDGYLKFDEEKIDLGSTDYQDDDGSTVSVPNEPSQAVGYYEDSEGTLYAVKYYEFKAGSLGTIYRKGLFKLTPVIEEAKPYVLAWYNDTDCGAEFDNLAKIARVEYIEVDRWNDDRTDVLHEIQLAYPRAGRKRFDLRAALDENLLAAFILSEDDDAYASEVMVRGRGKGRAAVRAFAGRPDFHRVRRVKIVSDPTIRTYDIAAKYASDEVLRAMKVVTIGELVFDANHPNMPIGSFREGDDVLVSARVSYGGDLELWHRIISYTWKPDSDQVVAQVRRSEQFAYGRPVSGVTEGDNQ